MRKIIKAQIGTGIPSIAPTPNIPAKIPPLNIPPTQTTPSLKTQISNSVQNAAGDMIMGQVSGALTGQLNNMLGWDTNTAGGRLGSSVVSSLGGAAITGATRAVLSGGSALSGAKSALGGIGVAGGINMGANILNNTLFGKTRGFGKGYQLAQTAVGFIPGVGQALSAGMAVGNLVNNALGTKTDTMSQDNATWTNTGDSYWFSRRKFADAMNDQDVRYGAVQSGARKKANAGIHMAGRDQNVLASISNDVINDRNISANQLGIGMTDYINDMTGIDWDKIHAAKDGAKLSRARRIISELNVPQKVDITPYEFDTKAIQLETEHPYEFNVQAFKRGGQMNVIPEGALHARKHHMEDDESITKKGIPVITEEHGEIVQQAEIERNEIIFTKEVTEQLEKWFEEYNKDTTTQSKKDELAIKAGKLLADEIVTNTDDRTGLLQEV